MLKKFADNGVNIFLNLIYGFPTESNEEFAQTFSFYRRVKQEIPQISVQFNKFSLFFGSDIFLTPDEFDLQYVENVEWEEDLRLVFDYEDKYGRRQSTPPDGKFFLASIGMEEGEYAKLVEDRGYLYLDAIFQINYASFGLIHKEKTNENLISILS